MFNTVPNIDQESHSIVEDKFWGEYEHLSGNTRERRTKWLVATEQDGGPQPDVILFQWSIISQVAGYLT